MPGPPTPGTPPEVPEEFADAYRAAYEAALEAQAAQPIGTHRRRRQPESGPFETLASASSSGTRESPLAAPESRVPEEGRQARLEGSDHRLTDSAWFVPALLGVLALLLVLGAYALGRSFAHQVAGHEGKSEKPRVVMSEDGTSREQKVTQQTPVKGAFTGDVVRVDGVRATARCTSAPGQDASGAAVTYQAAHLTDGAVDTAWRCDGSGVGQRLTLSLGQVREIGEVGLIPGYAKTDETDGTDRYAENNRVTKVRWSLGGKQYVQTIGANPKDRSLRLMRVPKTKADSVTLQILGVAKGPRDATAISEVELFATS